MRRVMVIGCSGSGKSTLARRLGERLDLPVVPRIVSAIERFGAHLRLIQLFRDRDGENFLTAHGAP